MVEFPIMFENPLLGFIGFGLGGTFVLLFYFSHVHLGTAEKKLELVKWKRLRKVVNFTNLGTKVCVVVALSLLVAVPFFPTTVNVPIDELSGDQLGQSSVTVMLLMDVSNSMNYSDLQPSRLHVSSSMVRLFTENAGLKDLIGFMSFAGEIYTEANPTLNKSLILSLIDSQTLHNSTAIGTALTATLGMLDQYEGGRAILLFSDGKNNMGIVNLTSVAESALAMKIPVFTVFVGTYGIGEADPVVLQQLSSISGGKFYEVKSDSVDALVSEIAKISQEVKTGALKSVFDMLTFDSRDYYAPMIVLAALLIVSLFLMWFTGV
jgi:hypothetical protein